MIYAPLIVDLHFGSFAAGVLFSHSFMMGKFCFGHILRMSPLVGCLPLFFTFRMRMLSYISVDRCTVFGSIMFDSVAATGISVGYPIA